MADAYKTEVIDPGDAASKIAAKICAQSYGNNNIITVNRLSDYFRAGVSISYADHILEAMLCGDISIVDQNDGAGGKPQFHALVSDPFMFRELAWEPITMVADDIAREGGLPVRIMNDLNVQQITPENFHLVEALLEGYGKALKQSGLVNTTGEIAIMKHSVTGFCNLNRPEQLFATWGASCIGLKHRQNIINPASIRAGMPIVGFRDLGYRCNGGTLLIPFLINHSELFKYPAVAG